METSFEKIISATGVKALGARPKTLSQNQRADVVYWNKKDNPIGVIEIKRHFDFHRFYPDIERAAKLLEKYGVDQGGTLRWGAIASLRQWWKGEKKDEHDILDYFLDECVSNFPNFKFDAQVNVDKLEPPEEYEDGMVFYGYRAFAVLFRLIRT